jgi:hypothetical protein
MKSASFLLALSISVIALAQVGSPVRISDDPPPSPVSFTYVYSSGQVIAICSSPSTIPFGASNWRATVQVPITSISNANPAIVTSAFHGLDASLAVNGTPAVARPSITITGATASWMQINQTFVATVLTADTFSIPVDTSALGAFSQTGISFTTTGPRAGQPEWAVQKIFYDASGNATQKLWLAGVQTYTNRCTDATSTTIQVQ